MIELNIPGFGSLKITHLVSDYNGTLAVDGRLLPGVKEALDDIARQVDIHIVTADTFGLAQEALAGVNCTLAILPAGDHALAKQRLVERLGAEQTIALGNGRNDRLMLQVAAVGIVVLLEEGASSQAVRSADILVPGILPALAYLKEPRRLIATLRG